MVQWKRDNVTRFLEKMKIILEEGMRLTKGERKYYLPISKFTKLLLPKEELEIFCGNYLPWKYFYFLQLYLD